MPGDSPRGRAAPTNGSNVVDFPLKHNPVKRALKAGQPQIGTWLSLGSVVAARFLARTGLPWLTVDMEHSHTDIQTAAMMFGAIADANCVPLARVPAGRHDYIKMVLDCGAMGIVAPMVMSAEEARTVVAACKFPPTGNRSLGGSLHALNYGCSAEDYFAKADGEILVVIQAEHIKAVEIADEIYSVPGIDAIFVGPNDLAASLRLQDGTPPGKGQMEDTLGKILAAAKRNGVPCGLHVNTAADAVRRVAEGWQFIAVASELKLMLEGTMELVKTVNPDRSAADLAKY